MKKLFYREGYRASEGGGTELPTYIYAKAVSKIEVNLEYTTECLHEEWWFKRIVVLNDEEVTTWFGPYPDEEICNERMYRDRYHESISSGGGLMQNVNQADPKGMIKDIFGEGLDFRSRRV